MLRPSGDEISTGSTVSSVVTVVGEVLQFAVDAHRDDAAVGEQVESGLLGTHSTNFSVECNSTALGRRRSAPAPWRKCRRGKVLPAAPCRAGSCASADRRNRRCSARSRRRCTSTSVLPVGVRNAMAMGPKPDPKSKSLAAGIAGDSAARLRPPSGHDQSDGQGRSVRCRSRSTHPCTPDSGRRGEDADDDEHEDETEQAGDGLGPHERLQHQRPFESKRASSVGDIRVLNRDGIRSSRHA